MVGTAAQIALVAANLLLVVNFFRSACVCCAASTPSETPFRQPSALEAHAS
jgi:hypothetical protein